MKDVFGWIRWMEEKAPRQLASIRRLTLAGRDDIQHYIWDMPSVRKTFPQIKALAFQLQTSNHRWVNHWLVDEVNMRRWRDWDPVKWCSGCDWDDAEEKNVFGRHVTFVIEGMMWVKAVKAHTFNGQSRSVSEQQIVVRVVRDGKVDGDGDKDMSGTGWADEDVKLKVLHPGGLVEPKRNADWRGWWRGKDYDGFA
jgi:hypothetical protein